MPSKVTNKVTTVTTDSGHETLLSDDDSPTPTVERASSEVIYSTITTNSTSLMMSGHPRSRRSLAESSAGSNLNHFNHHHHFTTINNNNNNNNNNDDEDDVSHHPPMIAPVSGVPNLKGKAVIRPIAFRPTPGPNSGASTPTNGPAGPMVSLTSLRPPSSNGPDNIQGLPRASPATKGPGGSTPTNEGFAPGHPLVKDGRRHYGSSQELHVAQPPPPAFNKFNSLDRRALSRRHHVNGQAGSGSGLLTLPSNSGPDSLPPVANSNGSSRLVNCSSVPGISKEPERRHSSYDPATSRSVTRIRATPSSATPSSAININGLPEPFNSLRASGANGSVYSSQESLNRQDNRGVASSGGATTPLRSTSATSNLSRPGAGTPQFQNLSGVVRTTANGLAAATAPSRLSGTTTTTLTSLYHQGAGGHHHHSRPSTNGHSSGVSTVSSSSSGHSQDMNTTPSPSDSAVGDLETMLKEKDTEINYLRETMEQNEQVIFKVYEEKEKMWERELRKIKGLYDNRLRASQQKSSKMEQALTNQTYQLQNEKRRLERDLEDIRRQREDQLEENQRLKLQVEELRHKLKNDASNKSDEECDGELELRVECRRLRLDLERSESQIVELQAAAESVRNDISVRPEDDFSASKELASQQKEIIISRDRQVEKLQVQVDRLRDAISEMEANAGQSRETFEQEKAHWLDEKEKVIRYQKQLQLNYVQMYKRNKTLEAEIETLNKSMSDLGHQLEEAKVTKTASKSSSSNSNSKSGSNSAQSRLQKTGNSVRARLFKMSLHSESQC